MKALPNDVTNSLDRIVLDFLDWIKQPVRRHIIVSYLQIPRTSIYDALDRLHTLKYVSRSEKIHGKGRPWVFWELSAFFFHWRSFNAGP